MKNTRSRLRAIVEALWLMRCYDALRAALPQPKFTIGVIKCKKKDNNKDSKNCDEKIVNKDSLKNNPHKYDNIDIPKIHIESFDYLDHE